MFEARIPFDYGVTIQWVIPMLVFVYVQAILVQLPRTRLLRITILLPGLLFLTQCARIDCTANSSPELRPGLAYLNLQVATHVFSLAMRFVVYGVVCRPYRRIGQLESPSLGQVLLNAGDLIVNARGVSWSWGVLRENTSPNAGRWSAICYSSGLVAIHAYLIKPVAHVIHALNPALRDPVGASLYYPPPVGHTLPIDIHPLIAFRLSPLLITICLGVIINAGVVYSYNFLRIIALLAGGDLARWPHIVNAPWAATSLRDLWNRRWHQIYRHSFKVLGVQPARALGTWIGGKAFGSVAGLLGGFALSACLHIAQIWGLGHGADVVRPAVFFVMMAVGIAMEYGWQFMTGRHVCGLAGWVWTYGWTVWWGQYLVEAYCLKGLLGQDCYK
ncbi:hypothetical protein HDZ31DRAFT_82991 [Schizophyllum fasciatum]